MTERDTYYRDKTILKVGILKVGTEFVVSDIYDPLDTNARNTLDVMKCVKRIGKKKAVGKFRRGKEVLRKVLFKPTDPKFGSEMCRRKECPYTSCTKVEICPLYKAAGGKPVERPKKVRKEKPKKRGKHPEDLEDLTITY